MGCSQVVRQRTLTLLFVGSSPPTPVLIPTFILYYSMVVKIQFIEGFKESTLPIIKLTKSRNGKTGTATFIFIQPIIFEKMISKGDNIDGIDLIWENKKISTKDINIFFREGNPFLIKAIFIFKNASEWFNFLNFMNNYSKETGLSFAEKH